MNVHSHIDPYALLPTGSVQIFSNYENQEEGKNAFASMLCIWQQLKLNANFKRGCKKIVILKNTVADNEHMIRLK